MVFWSFKTCSRVELFLFEGFWSTHISCFLDEQCRSSARAQLLQTSTFAMQTLKMAVYDVVALGHLNLPNSTITNDSTSRFAIASKETIYHVLITTSYN